MVMVVDRMAPLDELPGAGVDVGMLVATYQKFELNLRIRTIQIFTCAKPLTIYLHADGSTECNWGP